MQLSEWIRQTAPRDVDATVLETWALAAEEMENAGNQVVNPKRSEGAKKAWEKIRANKLAGPPPEKASPITVNVEQRELIAQAVDRVRESEQEPEMTEGRAIELIAADFLAGA